MFENMIGSGSGMMALIAGFFAVFLVIALLMYVYSALVLMAISKKTKTENGWLAWIPIANVWLMIQLAEAPWWTIFALFLPIVPILGGLALMVITVWWWWKIAERLGKPGWFGILIPVPVANLIVMGILAWGK